MNSRKRKKDDPCALCARFYPDDGVDPRDDKRRDAESDKNTGRKLHQLCRQVARTLQLAFGALPQAGAFAGVFVREARQLADVWIEPHIAGRLVEEAPAAYKDLDAVMRAQRDLVRILRRVRPVLCHMGI